MPKVSRHRQPIPPESQPSSTIARIAARASRIAPDQLHLSNSNYAQLSTTAAMRRASPPCSHGSSLQRSRSNRRRLGRVAKNRSGRTRKNRARKIHRLLASEADDLGDGGERRRRITRAEYANAARRRSRR
jgi:hypothetical protein